MLPLSSAYISSFYLSPCSCLTLPNNLSTMLPVIRKMLRHHVTAISLCVKNPEPTVPGWRELTVTPADKHKYGV